MDPIAGAFQNYGDIGYYRDQWGGKDSLANTYKWPEDGNSPYQDGDTWYRDMREPGFYGETVPDADHSLQWLAQQIINDDRFAISAVKFWWPAVIGSKPVNAPEISSDYDYESKTAVYNAQSAYIATISDSLRNHLNLKDTFVDIAMSDWFRSSSMTEEAYALHASNTSGKGRLLSPELLDKKTKAVFGVSWGEHYPEWDNYQRHSELTDNYRLTYGGIDSDGVINRAEQMTSIMSQVALTHSAEMACNIVVRDFIKDDNEKLLFKGINRTITPNLVSSQVFEVDGYEPGISDENSELYATGFHKLDKARYIASVSLIGDFWDEETRIGGNLIIDKILVKSTDDSIVYQFEGGEFEELGTYNCGGPHNSDDFGVWGNCTVNIPIEFDTEGEYQIEVYAYQSYWDSNINDWPPKEVSESFEMSVVLSVSDAISQNSLGGNLTKQTIVDLIQKAWGDDLTINDPEVSLIYEMFVTSWTNKKNLEGWNNHIAEEGINCNFPFWQHNRPEDGYDAWELGDDPQAVMSAWRTVILYLMTDYRYLHE